LALSRLLSAVDFADLAARFMRSRKDPVVVEEWRGVTLREQGAAARFSDNRPLEQASLSVIRTCGRVMTEIR